MHEMTLEAITYKVNQNTDRHIAKILVPGFTRQLKGWWGDYVSQEDKLRILSAIKIEQDGTELCYNFSIYYC